MKRPNILFGTVLILLLSVACQKQSLKDDQLAKTPEEIYEQRAEEKKNKKLLGKHKFKGPDDFAEFHQQLRTAESDKYVDYPVNYKLNELYKAKIAKQQSRQQREDLQWVERGPTNVPGRTRAIVNPTDNRDHWIVGSVAGGIWETTNAGIDWKHLTPDLPSMSISCLVQAPSNSNIIYAGSGEQYAGYNSVKGDGILKSTDKGQTWELLSSTSQNINFRNINRIVVDPTNENVLLAATSVGFWEINEDTISKIMKSTDGGDSWNVVYESTFHVEQIVAAPADFNIQYATLQDEGIIKSEDAGASWFDVSAGIVVDGRTELAVSPSDPDKVFASSESDVISSGSVLYVTENGGDTWNLAIETNGSNIDLLGGQGFYDNTVAVHPFNDNIAYVGGVNLFKNTVGAQSAEEITTLLGAEENGTEAFMDFVTFNDVDFNNGSIAIELNEGTDITEADFVAVEIRFGPGKSQKAHRYRVPPGTTSGFPLSSYIYGDYSDVPFEVWDVTNNKQLMVSYRDQQNNDVFNLNEFEAGGTNATSREYLFIHAIDYDANTPNSELAQTGGVSHKMMYFMWPHLAEGALWDDTGLPESNLKINWGAIEAKSKVTTIVSDAYGNFAPQGQSPTNPSAVIHPDHHNIMVQVIDKDAQTFRLIVTNDGGVYYSNISDDPGVSNGDWTFAGNGYNTTQFYGVDKSPVADIYIGGTQDNGTYRSPLNQPDGANAWNMQIGGDGFEVVWNKGTDDRHALGSIYNNQIRKTRSRGIQWFNSVSGLSDVGDGRGPFITKLSNSPKAPDLVFAVGATGVWRSEDFADSWQVATIDDEDWRNSSFLDVEVSLANPDYVMAGNGVSQRHALWLSTNRGQSFTKLPKFVDDFGVISGLHSHPTQDSTFYALFSFNNMSKVYRTEDLGQTWTDLSKFQDGASTNGFPDVAAYCLLVREDSTDIIWVGTEIGIIESTDNGETWALEDNGLEKVSIWDLKYWDGQVIAGTHGRGVWTVDVADRNIVSVQNLIAESAEVKLYPNPTQGQLTLDIDFKHNINNLKLKVYSYLGFEQLEVDIDKGELVNNRLSNYQLDVTELPIGAYFIDIETDKGAIQQSFIKQN